MVGRFSMTEEYYYNNLMRTFPEDIECIIEPKNGKGGIYVSNIEAAENPKTLQSIKC